MKSFENILKGKKDKSFIMCGKLAICSLIRLRDPG